MTGEPFRVFCGWDRRQAEAAEVFEYSVEQNANIPVTVYFLSADPSVPKDGFVGKRHGVTAFTYARFAVPWMCGFEGRALFADGADMLCLGDVRELAEWDMQGKPVWVVKHKSDVLLPRFGRYRSWTSLMLMDCAQFEQWTPDWVARQDDKTLMLLRPFDDDQIGDLPGDWNKLIEPDTRVAPGWYDVNIAHWSYLSDPNGGSWIDRSGSALWREWRERWRASLDVGKAAVA